MKKKNLIFHILSFLLPCCGMLLIFALGGRSPFGEDTALEIDAAIQYYPFTLLIRRILHNGESLFFSWRTGFGLGIWSLIAYYCANPWTLICALLPESLTATVLTLSICVRIGMAGLCFSVLLGTCKEKLDLNAVIFSVMYALCAWFAINNYQLIWLDTVALTPLVLAGLLRMIRDDKYLLYILSLFCSLLFNPYMAYITALMTGICWIGGLIILRKPKNAWLRETGKFLGCSLLAAGLDAVFLLPLAMTLRELGTVGDVFPALTETEFSFFAMIGQSVSYTTPVIHVGLPNIACGVAALFLLPGFLTAKRIPLRERIVSGCILLFLAVSLWYAPLNFIWHGFHTPRGFIHRFAHLLPLTILFMGWRFTDTLENAESRKRELLRLLPMTAYAAAAIFLAAHYERTDVPFLCTLFLGFYLLLYGFYILKPKQKNYFLLLMLAFSMIECWSSAYLSIGAPQKDHSAEDLLPAPETKAAVETIHADAASKQRSFFRTAVSPEPLYNAELLYDIPFGGSLYCSLLPDPLCVFCDQIGMDSGSQQNIYFYHPLPPFSMLLTGLQYAVISDTEQLPASMYTQLDQTNGYAFQYDAMAGFCIPQGAETMPEANTRIEMQQALFSQLTGLDELPYQFADLQADVNGKTVNIEQGALLLEQTDDKNIVVTISAQADADGWYVYDLQLESGLQDMIHTIEIQAGADTVCSESYFIGNSYTPATVLQQIGDLEAGTQFKCTFTFAAQATGTLRFQIARQDEDAFAAGYEALHAEQLELNSISDTALTGEVYAADDRILYLPIPYDSNWQITLDGKPIEACRVFGAMTGIPLTSGTHTLKMRYLPRGFVTGAVISICSAGVLIIVMILLRKKDSAAKSVRQEAKACEQSK